ncbi:MAG: MFS transporter [Chloroflexi bacterium]|nr:MFS transporter [Chloroflexota bacterium]
MADRIAETAPSVRGSARGGSLATTFSALKHPNYRLFFAGQLTSLTGTWMQNVAQAWLVYDLTKSPFYLGIVSFASALPSLLLSLWAGVLIDRMPKRRLLIITQASAMTLAFILAVDVFAGTVQPWHIVILSFLLGAVNAFDAPTRQAFVVEMVGREDLMNAIALNSAMFNSARILGPSIAGIVLAAVGPAWCFFINGISFLAVIASLSWMQVQPFVGAKKTESPVTQMREGLRYIVSHQTVRTLIGLVAIANIFAFGYSALIPAFARDILRPDGEVQALRALAQNSLGATPVLQNAVNGFAEGLLKSEVRQGLLVTFVGLGALAGALILASFAGSRRRGVILTFGNMLFPVMVLLFAFSQSLTLSFVILIVTGLGFMIQNATVNTLIQTSVPDELRGRVMSVFMLVFNGFFPIGALLAGTIAEHWNIPAGAAFGGSVALAFSVFLHWRAPYLRKLA